MRRPPQFRLRSLFIVVTALAVCLAFGKYLLIAAFFVLLIAGMPPFSYVVVPSFALLLAGRDRCHRPLRAILIASLLTVLSPFSMLVGGVDLGGGYGLPFTLAIGNVGPTYAAFVVIRFRRRELFKAGRIDLRPTVGSATSEALCLFAVTLAMAWYTCWSFEVWGHLWNWTSPTVDRWMPYLIGISALATIGLLWKTLCRMVLAWRLTMERHYARKTHLQIASNTALETRFGD